MSCRDRCRYAQYCYDKGQEGLEPENCSRYYKIEDILWDAECMAREHPHPDEEEEIPFSDEDYDGPEEEEF